MTRSYALSPDLLAMSQVWDAPGNGLAGRGKGAPEAMADLCRLDARCPAGALTVQVDQMAGAGLRVLAWPRRRAYRP